MFKQKAHSDRGKSIPVGLAIGIAVSMITMLCCAAAAAWMVSAEKIGEGSMGFITGMIHILSAAAGALTAAILVKRLRLQICLLTGLGYYMILLAVTALMFEGQYRGLGSAGLMITISCAAVALISGKKSASVMKKKHAYR